MNKRPVALTFYKLLTALLLLCSSTYLTASGGSGGTGIATGTISGFGSIFVNGIEYDIRGANLVCNGIQCSESDFKLGEIVTIEGVVDHDKRTGIATSVIYTNILNGPVTETSNQNRIKVLGQTVTTTRSTVLEDIITLNELQPGHIVEVSGFHDADGNIVATRMTRLSNTFKTGLSIIEARVLIEKTNSQAKPVSLVAGDLTIRIGQNTPIPAPGDFVHVKSTEIPLNLQLHASELSVIQRQSYPAGTRLNIEGIVTALNSESRFIVNGIEIQTNDHTRLENPTGNGIALNRKLEADGVINSKGVLVASSIEIAGDHTSSEFNGNIQKIDHASKQVQLFDRTFPISESTQLHDSKSGLLDFTQLKTGDWVEIYFTESDGNINVELLERKDAETDEIEGPVTAINSKDSSLVMLGKTIVTNDNTRFTGPNGNRINADAFFRSIALKTTMIDAKGIYNPSSKKFEAHSLHVED
ncbi:hypothetical protein BOW16_01595 [Solemya velum gill symbiont]|uniref:DUF5666 domain-containing protein n=1 Tax=Solemya velum gill symbiont TaxID=2340 RepID=A0A0B0HFG6_SOVGS|nr:DUF5666 domain-containing protein [Solemya velum gill symbiont]KHF26684.1 hypothetical protein JV46_23360 [Solemya velum gill symbiont]OOY53947.1 hypothetical protein BOV97_01770 [Solemya velum gill symbiont]OOY57748.1 hypothetical protein BOV99_01825 [Solemya velum gill symbiont]OOY58772.1 hypothetical protein BOW00_01825 [Solemya velum gill symbiont]OOY61409.1 hypothetical protein BOW02_03305 [Solemya velum gill symbiont]